MRKLLNNVYTFLPKMYQGAEVHEFEEAVNLTIHTKAPGVSAQKATTERIEKVMKAIGLQFEDVKGLSEDGKVVDLNKDFKWYINLKDKDAKGEYIKYERVTDLMGDKPFETAKLKSSQIIGTGIDNLIRDFFDPARLRCPAHRSSHFVLHLVMHSCLAVDGVPDRHLGFSHRHIDIHDSLLSEAPAATNGLIE